MRLDHVIIFGTALVAVVILASACVSDGAEPFKLTKEGDGEVEWSLFGNTLTLTPAKGGEILSFTVDGVDRVGELKSVGDGYEYVLPPMAAEPAVHVVFSDSDSDSTVRSSHALFVFVGVGAVAAGALFMVRRP